MHTIDICIRNNMKVVMITPIICILDYKVLFATILLPIASMFIVLVSTRQLVIYNMCGDAPKSFRKCRKKDN